MSDYLKPENISRDFRPPRPLRSLRSRLTRRRVPGARTQVVEPNQVHVVAAAMFCDAQQIVDALEPGFTGEIVRDVLDSHRLNRIDDDVAVVHRITTAHLDVRTRPDANGASDPPAPDSLAKAFREHHRALTESHTCSLQ